MAGNFDLFIGMGAPGEWTNFQICIFLLNIFSDLCRKHYMLNSIVYNSPRPHSSHYPYGVLAAGHSRFTSQDTAITSQFNEHTLILTTDGEGEIAVDGRVRKTHPFTISWVDTSADYSHGCATKSGAWTYLWFSFEGYASDQLYAQLAQRGQLHAFAGPDAVATFKLIKHKVSSNHPGRHAQLSSFVGQALALFENNTRQFELHDNLQHLAKTLTDNLADPWDTKTMAAHVGLSVSRFHSIFRAEFDIPPATWLREQRINAAKQLLTETDLTVTRIGGLCGYPDPHHFSREFAKTARLSPSMFRTQMRSRVAR